MQRSAFNHLQSKMALERVEVPVGVKQRVTVLNAKCRYERIDRRPHGDASSAQEAIIPRRADRNLTAAHGAKFERLKVAERAGGVRFGAQPLQHLSENQIADQQDFPVHQAIEQIGGGAALAVEVVDPDRRIDQGHSLAKRSRRIASRSPSQRSLPRNSRISPCRFNRTISSRLRSTASRLVLAPEARIASFIKPSSITILVRIANHLMCMLDLPRTHHKPQAERD